MNQAIQFPDREKWDADAQCVRFPVLINGMLAECSISKDLLCRRYGEAVEILDLFQNNRWDIEEEFEALIKQGLDESSVYLLSEDK